jgi:hypothetical protein
MSLEKGRGMVRHRICIYGWHDKNSDVRRISFKYAAILQR